MDNKIIYIKAYTNWLSDIDSFKYFKFFSEDGKGKYKNLQLTIDSDQADYFFVINFPLSPVPRTRDVIVFHMEPRVGVKQWGTYWSDPPRADFLQVRSHVTYPNCLEWHVRKSRSELAAAKNIDKFHLLSAVISDKYFDEGHIKRVDFLRFLDTKKHGLVDIYGTCQSLGFANYKGTLPHMDKSAALFPYLYHFAAENNAEPNYITEKLVDGIMAECLVFYYGAPNVHEIFGAAVISLQLADFEQDYNTICRVIETDEHTKRLPAIRRAKELILNQYSLYPTLHHTITSLSKRRQTYCLNLERRADRREQMVEKLAAVGLLEKTKFRVAIDGRSHQFTPAEVELFRGNDFGYKRGTMACALGHYYMWAELVADDAAAEDDYYFILEDDVEFDDTFARFVDYLITLLYERLESTDSEQWDMLFLGYQMFDENLQNHQDLYRKCLRLESVDSRQSRRPRIFPLNLDLYIGGFHCYLITKAGARKLCDFIARSGIKHGIDYLPKRYAAELGLRLYESQYHLATAKWVKIFGAGDTDIQVVGDELDMTATHRAACKWEDVLRFVVNL